MVTRVAYSIVATFSQTSAGVIQTVYCIHMMHDLRCTMWIGVRYIEIDMHIHTACLDFH